jgi:radical SAM superfamily enzyme YgiQ (UPF0313 family)
MLNPIVFTHAYFISYDPKEKEIMKPYPPLGILYLSAWLEQYGYENEVFDTTFTDKDTQKKYLTNHPPAILAIYTNLVTKINVIELIRFVKKTPELGSTLIVLGGPDVTHNADNYLKAGADVIVIGEGEQTMLELAIAVNGEAGKNFHHINGLVFKDDNGDIFRTGARSKIADIDTLPFPNRKKINLELYLKAWKSHHGKSTLSVSTQRGCPYTCRWCSTAVYGQSYRRRSPEKVVDELEYLMKTYSPDLFWFVDDVFTVSHKWLNAFHDTLKRRGLTVAFECITRADRLNPEVIAILKSAGCYRVWIGAESGSQRIIDAMDRRVDVVQVQDMLMEARRQGIETGTFIMLGYPGETERDIYETIHHLQRANPDLFTITVAYPIKGTGLYQEVESDFIGDLPWEESTDRDINFTRTYSRKYYDYAVRWVVNSVLWHKSKGNGQGLTPKGIKLLVKTTLARTAMRIVR